MKSVTYGVRFIFKRLADLYLDRVNGVWVNKIFTESVGSN